MNSSNPEEDHLAPETLEFTLATKCERASLECDNQMTRCGR